MEFSGHVVEGVAWSFIFPVGIWLLWKDKIALIFQQKTDLPGNLFFHIVSYARHIIEATASLNPIAHKVYKKEELVGVV
ncbi:hypothetical protein SESBI_27710 [Sesbania bispinosa]|nr:hypothetical protein SESBI_27710 [Sesbania bispinosa]